MVRKLEDYGVRDGNILGVRYGLRGLYAKGSPKPIALNSSMVDQVLREGGTILGTSVGTVDINEVVKRIDMLGINMLFVIGGEGGHMSAYEIQLAMQDNDVPAPSWACPNRSRTTYCSSIARSGSILRWRKPRGLCTRQRPRLSAPTGASASSSSWGGSRGSSPCRPPLPPAWWTCAWSQRSPSSWTAQMACMHISRRCWRRRVTPSFAWPRGRGRTSYPRRGTCPRTSS